MVDRDTDIDGGDLLEWLTGCGPVNTTVAVCEWKVHKSSSCSMRLDVSLVFSVCWNPEDVGFNASEGMDLPARVRTKQTKNKCFLLPCPLHGLPAEGVD